MRGTICELCRGYNLRILGLTASICYDKPKICWWWRGVKNEGD